MIKELRMTFRVGLYVGLLSVLAFSSPDVRAEQAPVDAAGRIFHVADFGAVGDGTTDDGPAVRKAVEAAVAAGAGSSVGGRRVSMRGAVSRSLIAMRSGACAPPLRGSGVRSGSGS